MMINLKKILIMGVLLTSQIFALYIPSSSRLDKRITFAKYNANNVFQIFGKNGYVSILEFKKDERVINIATGFSDGWDLIDKENFLFIKPKVYVSRVVDPETGQQQDIIVEPTKKDWKTNLIVTTNKRVYAFDLLLAKHEVYYKVSFSYPKEEKLKKLKELEKIKNENAKKLEAKKLEEELNRTTIPKNWNFYMKVNKGSETITPNFAYDDGVFTYLGFDTTKTFPSVFALDDEGNESILNTHVKKDGKFDVLVIHKTTKLVLLRSGNKVVGILNKGYAKNPLDETKETNSFKVKREVIKDEK